MCKDRASVAVLWDIFVFQFQCMLILNEICANLSDYADDHANLRCLLDDVQNGCGAT